LTKKTFNYVEKHERNKRVGDINYCFVTLESQEKTRKLILFKRYKNLSGESVRSVSVAIAFYLNNKGNLNTIQGSLKTLLRKPALVTRTFLPLVEKALIELLGNSSSYIRDSFVYNITVSNNQIVYDVSMTYSVSLFIGTDIDKAAVAHDQKYIADTISVVPGIRIKNVAIDTSTGLVSISVEI
jgi:hypothetical protein